MRKRPLCFVCLIFLLIQSCIYVAKSGKTLNEIPASSIFFDNKEKHVLIEGQVYKKEIKSKYQILYLKNNSVYDSQLLVYDEKFIEIAIGQRILFEGKTMLFENARNPGNFDAKRYYARHGFYGAIWCEDVVLIDGNANLFKEQLYRLKCYWKEQLIKHLGEKNGGILSAILLGNKSDINPETKELYQVNGIGHILAISGLHVSFIGIGIYTLFRRIGLPFTIAGFLAGSVLLLYAVMIGWSVSVVRAVVMLLFKIGADIFGRVYDSFTALFAAAVINVMCDPYCFTDAGFYLSYGALLGILFLAPVLRIKMRTSMAIQLTLLPITLWFYYEIPIHSILLNLVIIPMTSVVLGSGLIGSLLLCFIKPVGTWMLQICGMILNGFGWLTEYAVRIPYTRLTLGKPKLCAVILYYLLLLVYVLYKRKRKIKAKFSWAILWVAIAIISWRESTGLTITMLDVGQGDGIFIQGPGGATYFIDGGSSDINQLAKNRIEPFLKYRGVGELDYVFITHGDLDHCSGIIEMIRRKYVGVQIKHLVLPIRFQKDETLLGLAQEANEAGIELLVMQAGDEVKEKEMYIRCLQPCDADDELEGNAGSLVLEMEYKEFSMLFTGDVEEEGEERLTNRVEHKTYDVLKVAHHGSKNSTTETFLETIAPQYALISAGKDNSYGHPHEETITRLKNVGCEVYITTKKGAITITTDGNSLTFY